MFASQARTIGVARIEQSRILSDNSIVIGCRIQIGTRVLLILCVSLLDDDDDDEREREEEIFKSIPCNLIIRSCSREVTLFVLARSILGYFSRREEEKIHGQAEGSENGSRDDNQPSAFGSTSFSFDALLFCRSSRWRTFA